MPKALQNLWHAITAQYCQDIKVNSRAACIYHISTAGAIALGSCQDINKSHDERINTLTCQPGLDLQVLHLLELVE